MRRTEGFIRSEDQTKLYYCIAEPDGTEVKSMLLLHGYGEHCRRYDHVTDAFAAAGIRVLTFDFRGHGRSLGRRGFIRSIDEYMWDIDAALLQLRGSLNTPTLLMGHSMGGASTLAYALRSPERVAAFLLSSPYLGRSMHVNPIKLGAGHVLGRWMPTIGLPSGLSGDMVSHDPEVQRVYNADPLNNKNATAGWFVATEKLHERLRGDLSALTMPSLVTHGDADPIASYAATQNLFTRLPAQDKTFVSWPGLLHEPLNESEPDRTKVIKSYVEWVLKHAK